MTARWAAMRLALFRSHPARLVVLGFATVIVIGTTLLALPISADSGDPTPLISALFTATSAVCVTGLVVVDTGEYWSAFGEGVVLALIQIGGFGIMTMASLLALLISGKLRLRMQLTAQTETKSLDIGDVRRVLLGVALTTVAVELTVTAALALRFRYGYDMPILDALHQGLFHAVSAFNNAGFGLFPDSLMQFQADPWILLPIAIAVILGGLGFPVLLEVLRHRRRQRITGRRNWSLHTKLTLITSATLLLLGTLVYCAFEWRDPNTLGDMSIAEKLLNGFFQSMTTRTAGFNAIDTAELEDSSLMVTAILMFIGGGSAGTAGGIKVTTFAVLAVAILAEVRGEAHSGVLRRKLAPHVLRQALTVALLGVGLVVLATVVLLSLVDLPFEVVLFEAVSAFGTVGLSAGATSELGTAGEVVVILLMFVGRLGPVTLVSALALRERKRRYDLPEERPVIG
ncbi:TrkH family potassium uptake protein [Streptomyces sp. NPDC002851]